MSLVVDLPTHSELASDTDASLSERAAEGPARSTVCYGLTWPFLNGARFRWGPGTSLDLPLRDKMNPTDQTEHKCPTNRWQVVPFYYGTHTCTVAMLARDVNAAILPLDMRNVIK